MTAQMPSTDAFVDQIVQALRSVVGDAPAPLHAPEFAGREWDYVKECLDTTFVSSVGKFVDRFEVMLAEYTGAARAVAVVNGTAALHMALLLAGVRAGDEVLVPALTFVATANAVAYCGATPHFVDCEAQSLGVDVARLRAHLTQTCDIEGGALINRATGRVIRAIVPMHSFGHIGDIAGLVALARDFGLALIEDAAESLGSHVNGQHSGTFGLVGTLSFNGNKTITTGGGGAMLFADADLAKRAKHLTTTAKQPHAWDFVHDEVGYNYRLPNINAALGCAQMEMLPQFLAEKRALHGRYLAAFAGLNGATILTEGAGRTANYWLQTLILNGDHASARDALLTATNASGIMTRPIWRLMHRLAPYITAPRMDLTCAEDLEQRIINIPSSAVLGRA